MEAVLEAAYSLHELIKTNPMGQEIYLACFFCLGFIVFRTEAVKRVLSRRSVGNSFSSGHASQTLDALRGLLTEGRYEQVLDCWPVLEKYTPEALSAVVTSLLALDRPDDVGLFVAKAAVNLPHLKPSLHETIQAIVAPTCQAPRQRIALALRDVLSHASDSLDSRAKAALLLGFAKLNDADGALETLNTCGQFSPDILTGVFKTFLSYKNLPAALHYLERMLKTTRAPAEDLIMQFAQATTGNAIAEQGAEDEADSYSGISRLLDLLDRLNCLHAGALCKILVFVTRRGTRDDALVKRTESLLRAASRDGDALSLHAYSALIRASTNSSSKARHIFDEMVQFHSKPTESLLLDLLSACVSPMNCDLAQYIYRWAREHQLCTSRLASFFIKVLTIGKQPELVCKTLEEALQDGVCLDFDSGLKRQLVRVATQAGRPELATQIVGEGSCAELSDFQEEMQHRFSEKRSPGNLALKEAVTKGDLNKAWQVLTQMETNGEVIEACDIGMLFRGYRSQRHAMNRTLFGRAMGFASRHSIKLDEHLINAALDMCITLRDSSCLDSALAVFKHCGLDVPKECSTSMAAMLIKAHSSTHQIGKAWQLWDDMTKNRGVEPSRAMYAQMIDATIGSRQFDEALRLFQQMKEQHAARCDCQDYAIAYAAIIKAYAQQKDYSKALELFSEMGASQVTVGVVAFNTVLDACCRAGDMAAAARIFKAMPEQGVQPDLISYSTLIKGHCVKGDLEHALLVFGEMRRRGIKPDSIVFNSLLDGCARKQMPSLCQQVVSDMVTAGIQPGNHSASILIKLYGRIHDLDAAFRVVDDMPDKYGFRSNAAVYTTLMSACTWNGRFDLALKLRLRMREEGLQADEKTYSTLLRGALRAASCEDMALLMTEALDAEQHQGQHLLEEDMVHSCLQAAKKRRVWEEQGFEKITERLKAAGYLNSRRTYR